MFQSFNTSLIKYFSRSVCTFRNNGFSISSIACLFQGYVLWLLPFEFANKMHLKQEQCRNRWKSNAIEGVLLTLFPIIELDMMGKGFFRWKCKILYINNESNHSRDRGFVPSIVWALWLWPLNPGYWLLIMLVSQEINLILLFTLILSCSDRELNCLGWYVKKKTIFSLGSMECPYHSFN